MSQDTQIAIDPILDVPNWLMEDQPLARRTPREVRELTDEIYTAFFETILAKVAAGYTFQSIIAADNRDFDAGKVMYWIKKDPERTRRYYEAQEVGTELMVDELIGISDADDAPLEDVQRSTLKINTRKWIIQARNRNRYGDTKKVEIAKTEAPQQDHLERLAQRLVALRKQPDGVYDVETKLVD